MCREDIDPEYKPVVDKPTLKLIKTNFEKEYKKNSREHKKRLEILKKEKLKFVEILIEYGNLHNYVPTKNKNKHNWKLFVKVVSPPRLMMSDIVDSVEYQLHNDFGDKIRKLSSPSFQASFWGWGTFEIPLMLKFKKKLKVQGHL